MKVSIGKNDTVAAVKDQVFCLLGEDAVILHLGQGVYYSLNPVGARVWQLLQQPRTFQEVLEALLDEFDVEPARCEEDLRSLLDQLGQAGLVEVKDVSVA